MTTRAVADEAESAARSVVAKRVATATATPATTSAVAAAVAPAVWASRTHASRRAAEDAAPAIGGVTAGRGVLQHPRQCSRAATAPSPSHMASLALGRLAEERKAWRRDKPFGFFARPEAGADGCERREERKERVDGAGIDGGRGEGAALPSTAPTPFPPLHSAINLMRWTCGIPGREGTDWAGGVYPVTLEFSDDYPAKPPKVGVSSVFRGWRCSPCVGAPAGAVGEGERGRCATPDTPTPPRPRAQCRLPAGFFHPNIYPSGTVCLSILSEEDGWRPSLTVKNVLLGVQALLGDPNPGSPAQSDAYMLFTKSPAEYGARVRAQAGKYPPPA